MSSGHSKNDAKIGGIIGGFFLAVAFGLCWWWRRNHSGRRCTDNRNGEESLLMSRLEEGTNNAGKKKRNHVNGDHPSRSETAEEDVHSPLFSSTVFTTSHNEHPPRKYIKQEPSTAPRTSFVSSSVLPRPHQTSVTVSNPKVYTNDGAIVELTTFTPSNTTGNNRPSAPTTVPLKPSNTVPPVPLSQPAVPLEHLEPVQPPKPEPDIEDPTFESGVPPPAPVFPLCRPTVNCGDKDCTIVVPLRTEEPAHEGELVFEVEAACNKHWANTMSAVEQRLGERQTELRSLHHQAAVDMATLSGERQAATKLRADLARAEAAEGAALQRLANLTAKYGEGHVTRTSTSKSAAERGFPAGDAFIVWYEDWTAQVESLANVVCVALREEGQSAQAALETFVQQVAFPVHTATAAYVQSAIVAKQARMVEHFGPAATIKDRSGDDVAWLFFLYSQQPRLLADMRNLPQDDVAGLLRGLGPAVRRVQEQGAAVDLGIFVRKYLEVHVLAAMSDPRCYVFPAPGERVAFQSSLCKEILLPGSTSMSAQLLEGAEVEVILGGLCFEDPAKGGKPAAPLLVRRV